jgi:hypothetical protein
LPRHFPPIYDVREKKEKIEEERRDRREIKKKCECVSKTTAYNTWKR